MACNHLASYIPITYIWNLYQSIVFYTILSTSLDYINGGSTIFLVNLVTKCGLRITKLEALQLQMMS